MQKGYALSPKRLLEILDRLGLSRGGFALLLGATRKSGENWTEPGRRVPGPVAAIAELLDRRPEMLAVLREINPEVPQKRGKKS